MVNPYVERLIGSIRRDCLDHVVVLNENHLRRILESYFDYYQRCRTHLSLEKDAPEHRAHEPPEMGEVVELPRAAWPSAEVVFSPAQVVALERTARRPGVGSLTLPSWHDRAFSRGHDVRNFPRLRRSSTCAEWRRCSD